MDRFLTFFSRREEYELGQRKFLQDNLGYLIAGMVLYVVVLVVRSWGNLSNPGLYAEDSAHYFNFYYGNIRSFIDIFQTPNGYYNIFNNLVAWLVAKADIMIQPLLYQLAAISLVVVTISAFFSSGLIKSRYLLIVGPLLLGLSGMNHIYYYLSLTFQMYVVVLLLLILLLWQKKSSLISNVFLFVLMSFLIWSGPYSVLAVPFGLTFMVLFRGKTTLVTGLIIVTIAYTLSVKESMIMLENLFDRNIMEMWGTVIVAKTYLMGFKDGVNVEKVVLMFATLGGLLLILRKEKYYLKVALLLAVITVSSMAPLFLSKKYLLYQTVFPCHILFAQFFWLIFVLYSLDKILLRSGRYQKIAGVCVSLLIITFIFFDNRLHEDKYKVPVLQNIPLFLSQIKEAEQLGLKEQGQQKIYITKGTSVFHAEAIVGDRTPGAKIIGKVFVQ